MSNADSVWSQPKPKKVTGKIIPGIYLFFQQYQILGAHTKTQAENRAKNQASNARKQTSEIPPTTSPRTSDNQGDKQQQARSRNKHWYKRRACKTQHSPFTSSRLFLTDRHNSKIVFLRLREV
ncbi:hypothetical protein AVEN_254631-1 [Araneus ventricosus]|uniref:Uncharacterized protein n=1 Tax=Araneus ventricosus TaxID=182803 RepID=A0A4Y2GD10_ARAVE|nr:hypothetical protein AVEN_254631-1 [Araneus ventricosus]